MVRYVFNNGAVVTAFFAANGGKSISCRIQATKDVFLGAVKLVVDLPRKDDRVPARPPCRPVPQLGIQ